MSQLFKDVIRKYLRKDISESERERFVEWVSQLPSNDFSRLYDQLGDEIDELNEFELEQLNNMLRSSQRKKQPIVKEPVKVKRFPLFLKVAASVLIIGSLALAAGMWYSGVKQPSPYTVKQNYKGEKKRVVLPDGSIVWLNAESTIKYSSTFDGPQREIHLEGEAFFDVVRDEAKPFIVHTPSGVYTRVLGTSFNVNAYPDSRDIEVAVASGKVAVGKGSELYGELVKDQQLTFDKKTTHVTIEIAHSADAWTKGELVFHGEPFREVMATLGRVYDKQFKISRDVPDNLLCTGTFSTDQSAEEILNTLCILYHLEYKSENNIIRIMKGDSMSK